MRGEMTGDFEDAAVFSGLEGDFFGLGLSLEDFSRRRCDEDREGVASICSALAPPSSVPCDLELREGLADGEGLSLLARDLSIFCSDCLFCKGEDLDLLGVLSSLWDFSLRLEGKSSESTLIGLASGSGLLGLTVGVKSAAPTVTVESVLDMSVTEVRTTSLLLLLLPFNTWSGWGEVIPLLAFCDMVAHLL